MKQISLENSIFNVERDMDVRWVQPPQISNYKAEFAFSLVTTVNNEPQKAEQEKRQVRKLTVPPYILKAFTFIQES